MFQMGMLTYSATARCPCGTGLVYGADTAIWCCASTLDAGTLTIRPRKGHCHPRKVGRVEIMDENDPAAAGQTTRPV